MFSLQSLAESLEHSEHNLFCFSQIICKGLKAVKTTVSSV
jgi:hypothetical protein